MHEYVKIRKKALGVEELHMYDLYAPMVKDAKPVISFEEAKKIVKEGLHPLGEEYLQVLRKDMITVGLMCMKTKGKEVGLTPGGAYGVHPYVSLKLPEYAEQCVYACS